MRSQLGLAHSLDLVKGKEMPGCTVVQAQYLAGLGIDITKPEELNNSLNVILGL
jgi:hypothetical protein